MKIDTVILAAGESRRLGFNKLCLRVNGKAAVRRTVELFLENGPGGKLMVVTGFEAERIEGELAGLSVIFVHNELYSSGMSSSVKTILPYVTEADLVLFHLGDKPFVAPEIIRNIEKCYGADGSSIVVPVHEGVKGHPVLINVRRYLSDACAIKGDRGLRDVIDEHVKETFFFEGGEGVVLDMDTEEDISLLRRRGYIIEKG